MLQSRLLLTSLALIALVGWADEPAPKKPDGNRLAYLDEPLNPYYPHKDFPKLITPQWVGEEGVECVVTLGIDDMRDPKKYEAYLRPILDCLKQIDGRAPVSIMTCQVKPDDPQLQAWLKEGLSIECHTYDHPCPCLKESSLAKAKETYDKCVDLINEIPGNKPVAFRMPCCDSLNTPSPRFWAEVFNKTTAKGNFLRIDSSVFNIITGRDESLPKEIRFNEAGEERFRRYVPFKDFVNTIEDYPYPYIIGRMCWEFPCVVPSDWSAQHVQKPNNPDTVRDWKLALDAMVIKQGVFNLVFHPHGWIRPEQIVELIDYAVEKHGKKVKFLTFKECAERLSKNLLKGVAIRRQPNTHGEEPWHDLGWNGVAVVDVDADGLMDVAIGSVVRADGVMRRWAPAEQIFEDSILPTYFWSPPRISDALCPMRAFGALGTRGGACLTAVGLTGGQQTWTWSQKGWERADGPNTANDRLGVRYLDLDGDGNTERIDCRVDRALHFPIQKWSENEGWTELPFSLSFDIKRDDERSNHRAGQGCRFVDIDGDNKLDCLFSNAERYSLHLFKNMQEGWSIKVIEGVRGQPGGMGPEIPPFVRADGTNNGAFFHSKALWIINEDTAKFPNHAFKLTFEEMLREQTKGRR